MSIRKIRLTRAEVAEILTEFVQGTGGRWDWDDFISFPIEDERLDQIRERCTHLSEEFPPDQPGQFTGPRGIEGIKQFIDELAGSPELLGTIRATE